MHLLKQSCLKQLFHRSRAFFFFFLFSNSCSGLFLKVAIIRKHELILKFIKPLLSTVKGVYRGTRTACSNDGHASHFAEAPR